MAIRGVLSRTLPEVDLLEFEAAFLSFFIRNQYTLARWPHLQVDLYV